MSYHFIPSRMSKTKKTRNTSVGKDGEEVPVSNMAVTTKILNVYTFDPAIQLLGTY